VSASSIKSRVTSNDTTTFYPTERFFNIRYETNIVWNVIQQSPLIPMTQKISQIDEGIKWNGQTTISSWKII